MGLRMKVKVSVLAMAFLLILMPSRAASYQNRAALVGLKGVWVLVESVHPETESQSLIKDQIKTDVELRLRKAGIRVLTPNQAAVIPGKPVLLVYVNAAIASGICVYVALVQLTEDVTLARGIETTAITWDAYLTGSIKAQNISKVRKDVSDLVDKFITDYRAANPK